MDILEATERASASVRGKERVRERQSEHTDTRVPDVFVYVHKEEREREREREREKHTPKVSEGAGSVPQYICRLSRDIHAQ